MKRVITAFKEHKEFKRKKHWDANILRFQTEIVTPPHYADTVEIIVNHGAVGDIHIGGKHCKVTDHLAYYIPPNAVHSIEYQKSDGYVSVLKINHLTLKQYLDLESVLEGCGHSFESLPYYIDDPDVVGSIERTYFESESIFTVLTSTLGFFKWLTELGESQPETFAAHRSDDIRRIIEWSEQNFTDSPTLEEAAAVFGYNKNYFCQKFKAETGVTYVSYLNCLRINYACAQLKKGLSVTEVCYSCGFENPSYFIKLFRTMVGITPRKYAAGGE
ncbi:MAG: helix-turn-helix transcriptional regulator [Clostridia bacterium]|nr:helix-turn-helix transcriptional regulator [Clostridia bacterium]